jgi:hypothetical protein
MFKYFLPLLLFPSLVMSQTASEIERLNFFPKTAAFIDMGYQYQVMEIETPRTAIPSRNVLNHQNALKLTAAYKVIDQLFLGMHFQYEKASENAAIYGIEASERISSYGFREPDFFLMWRIKEQNGDQGLLDFSFSYSNAMGAREVGGAGANRLNGRNKLKAGLSHGLLEDKWEFRSMFELHHYTEGEEQNDITSRTYHLHTFNEVLFKFSSQYHLRDWAFINATIGVLYRGSQNISDSRSDDRKIQSGTGSLFEIGIKRPISENTVISTAYQYFRNEYFVKGPSSNLDGKKQLQSISLNLIHGF